MDRAIFEWIVSEMPSALRTNPRSKPQNWQNSKPVRAIRSQVLQEYLGHSRAIEMRDIIEECSTFAGSKMFRHM